MSTAYRRRKASLIEAVFVAQDTWRHLTKPQRRALLGEKPVHHRVQVAMHEKRLLRADGYVTWNGKSPNAWNSAETEDA